MARRTHTGGTDFDAVVVGAGPNGLSAAVTLARAGLNVCVFEKDDEPGGGARTGELTLPGFQHDICSAVHPLAFESPFFRAFELASRVEFAVPDLSFAHPLDGAQPGLAYRDLMRTCERLGSDGNAYAGLVGPLMNYSDQVSELTGGSLWRLPSHGRTALRFARRTLEQGTPLWNARFREQTAPALLAGVMAHTLSPLPSLAGAAAGLALTSYAHAKGWPIPIGGSAAISKALLTDLLAHGGKIITGSHITDMAQLPPSRAVLLDVTPRAFAELFTAVIPARYARKLRQFKYGNAAAKVDFALSEPIPWRDQELQNAGTIHLGGTREQIAEAEREVSLGHHPDRPYVLVSQPSTFDRTRAPAGRHTLWAYTHVPHGSQVDQTDTIIRQIERFAPGFRDIIMAAVHSSAADLSIMNPNYPGGDIAAGATDFGQMLARPVAKSDPWRTPLPGVYLCSASTAPGPGVHGLAGWHAARSALRREFSIQQEPELSRDNPQRG